MDIIDISIYSDDMIEWIIELYCKAWFGFDVNIRLIFHQ